MRITLPIAALCLIATSASAQPYEIDWYTVDAGGGTSSGGVYDLSGTIGQHDAGVGMTGSSYELTGGFWAGVGAGDGSCNVADVAPPFGTHDFTDVLAFLTAFSSMDPAGDLAPPTGTFDFSDVLAFLTAFGAGCP